MHIYVQRYSNFCCHRQNFKLYACWYVSQSCSFVLFYSYIQFQMLGTPFFIKIFPLLVSHSPNFFFKSLPFLKSSKFRFYWSIDITKFIGYRVCHNTKASFVSIEWVIWYSVECDNIQQWISHFYCVWWNVELNVMSKKDKIGATKCNWIRYKL